MVNFARVQNRIYYGYSKVAQHLGVNFHIYRSTDGLDPLKASNALPDQLIWIDQDFKANKSRKYGDMNWQFTPRDGLSLLNYDYLVGPTTTYFVGDIAPEDRFSPPLCVECNAVLSLYDPINDLTPGKNVYQAFDNNTKVPILTNCPGTVLQYTRMYKDNMSLPTSVTNPMYSIYLPDFDDVVIKTGQIIEDNKGRRLTVINAEQTKRSLGLRILAAEKEV